MKWISSKSIPTFISAQILKKFIGELSYTLMIIYLAKTKRPTVSIKQLETPPLSCLAVKIDSDRCWRWRLSIGFAWIISVAREKTQGVVFCGNQWLWLPMGGHQRNYNPYHSKNVSKWPRRTWACPSLVGQESLTPAESFDISWIGVGRSSRPSLDCGIEGWASLWHRARLRPMNPWLGGLMIRHRLSYLGGVRTTMQSEGGASKGRPKELRWIRPCRPY